MKGKFTLLVALVFFFGLILWAAGSYLSKPVNQLVKMPVEFEKIVFNSTHGSFLKSESNSICALLLHGVRSNRASMIGRASFLKDMGISSLLIDLQAHGETLGSEITFGIRESVDAANGVSFLKEVKECGKIVAIGQSLGGASALLGNGPIHVDALILESVYPTIEEAVQNRLEMRLGKMGKIIAPFLYLQIPLRIDVSLSELKPIEAIKKVNVPVFIISGSNDEHTKAEETERLFHAANESKQLWLVKGAAHEDLLSYRPEEYKAKISSFIKQSL
ncbi:alpha/beta hydrolase [Thiolinea disciformis]|uniref:alpha/beta hydrolase n=1 Tax=Thiolinea disciformis TaxID=125614 RepID=UPI00035F11DC|nr:alpha/beta hydrolase [Thiolinea disciformis]